MAHRERPRDTPTPDDWPDEIYKPDPIPAQYRARTSDKARSKQIAVVFDKTDDTVWVRSNVYYALKDMR